MKKVRTVIEINQTVWLEPYIDMNAKLRKKFFFWLTSSSWWIMHFLGKLLENERKYKKIKLVTTEKRSNYLLWEQPKHHTTVFFISYRNEKNLNNNEWVYLVWFINITSE